MRDSIKLDSTKIASPSMTPDCPGQSSFILHCAILTERGDLEVTVDRGRIGCQPARMPQRERYLFVCINRRSEDHPKGSCTARGSEEVHRALKEQLRARGLSTVAARVCTSSCLDQCSSGVCVLVEPDHFFYGRVTIADVPEIVEAIATGERVERLVLTFEDLAKG